jgi:hypothetical protein
MVEKGGARPDGERHHSRAFGPRRPLGSEGSLDALLRGCSCDGDRPTSPPAENGRHASNMRLEASAAVSAETGVWSAGSELERSVSNEVPLAGNPVGANILVPSATALPAALITTTLALASWAQGRDAVDLCIAPSWATTPPSPRRVLLGCLRSKRVATQGGGTG